MSEETKLAVVAGVGPALGAASCKALLDDGYRVVALSRSNDLSLVESIGGQHQGQFWTLQCDITKRGQVDSRFDEIRAKFGDPQVLIYNAHRLLIKPFLEIEGGEFQNVWESICKGAFNCSQNVIPGMLAQRTGSIVFTGATASIRGGVKFAAFASAKFALRGLAQSLAREFGPQGIHVAHVLIDGLIWGPPARDMHGAAEEKCIRPESIAKLYMHLINQDPSCWTQEMDIRPHSESF